MMNTITQIHISHTAFTIHYFIAVCSSSTRSMRCFINNAIVSLHFYNAARCFYSIPFCHQYFSKQFFCDLNYIGSLIKFNLQFPHNHFKSFNRGSIIVVLFIFTQIYVLLKEIVIAFQSFGEANLFIRQHKMVKWIIFPGIIYTILFLVAMILFAQSANGAVNWLSQQLRIEPWLQKERNPFLAFIFVMTGIMLRLVLFPVSYTH